MTATIAQDGTYAILRLDTADPAQYAALSRLLAELAVERIADTPVRKATAARKPRAIRYAGRLDYTPRDWYGADALARIERIVAERATWQGGPAIGPAVQRTGDGRASGETLREFAADRDGGTVMLPQLTAL